MLGFASLNPTYGIVPDGFVDSKLVMRYILVQYKYNKYAKRAKSMKIHPLHHANKVLILVTLLLVSALFSSALLAETSEQNAAIDKALEAALKQATNGPATVKLLDQATIKLSKQIIFVPAKEAAPLITAAGNQTTNTLVGLIMPQDSAFHWFIAVDFVKSGYVSDSAATKWKTDKLFSHLQDATDITNTDRKAKSFPTITLNKWTQEPTYSADKHELTWSVQGADSENYQFINDNVDMLGRDGYFTFTLLSQYDTINASKEEAEKIIATFSFNDGKTYDDHVANLDKSADYGLEGLIIGEDAARKTQMVTNAGIIIASVLGSIIVLVGGIIVLFPIYTQHKN